MHHRCKLNPISGSDFIENLIFIIGGTRLIQFYSNVLKNIGIKKIQLNSGQLVIASVVLYII